MPDLRSSASAAAITVATVQAKKTPAILGWDIGSGDHEAVVKVKWDGQTAQVVGIRYTPPLVNNLNNRA